MEDELVDIQKASEILGIAVSTIRRHMRLGNLNYVKRDVSIQGSPSMFNVQDLLNLKNIPDWYGPRYRNLQNSGSPLKLLRLDGRTEDEEYNGCIIHWSERFRNKTRTYTPITCSNCKVKFYKLDGQLVNGIKTGEFTGCCPNCYRSAKRKSTFKSDGIIKNRDGGYTHRHIDTFTSEEQIILRKMKLGNGIYIPEHRAIMALKLGRPLLTTENVHHIDGDKSNNDPNNLTLYSNSEHKKNHKDQLAEIVNLRARIAELEKELETFRNSS